jgi:hypothetical protein
VIQALLEKLARDAQEKTPSRRTPGRSRAAVPQEKAPRAPRRAPS